MRILIIFFCVVSTSVHAQDTLRLSLLFTGDIMQHDSQIAAAWRQDSGRYDYRECFERVKPVLSSADLTIGNLELTLAGRPYKGYPQFSAPDELLEALKYAGYDVLVTANNHCVDRGRHGLERTIDRLDSAGILHTGTFKDTLDWLNNYPLIVESKGFRLSLLNYTYGTNGMPIVRPNMVNVIDTARIRFDLARARAQSPDAVVVFFHWGKEYVSYPEPSQKELADFCFKHGAKLVIGAHPHVLQHMEWRKETDQLVVYSLGNFVSGQRDRFKNGGAMLHLDMMKVNRPDSTGSVVAIERAEYSLGYVHRADNPRRTYHILPLEHYEGDTTFVRTKHARESMARFAQDSRMLYGKENINVAERKTHITK